MILHEKEKNEFAAAVARGHIMHAYGIEGAKGCGKLEFAMFCAQTILCTGENKPCGECRSCRKIAQGNHPDLIIPEPQDGKKTLTVDEIRELRRNAFVVPNDGERKVYIFTDAQDMPGKNQNALLKVIEEPPKSAVFFFLTEKRSMLLPTVCSRLSFIKLGALEREDVFRLLRERHPKADITALSDAAQRSAGLIGKAEELLTKQSAERREKTVSLLKSLFMPSSVKYDFITSLTGLGIKADGVRPLLNDLESALGDLLRAKYGVYETEFFEPEEIREYARLCTAKSLIKQIKLTESVMIASDNNPNMTALLSYYATALWDNKN